MKELSQFQFVGNIKDDPVRSGNNSVSFIVLNQDDYKEKIRTNEFNCVLFAWNDKSKIDQAMEDLKKGNKYFFAGRVQSSKSDAGYDSVSFKIYEYVEIAGHLKNQRPEDSNIISGFVISEDNDLNY